MTKILATFFGSVTFSSIIESSNLKRIKITRFLYLLLIITQGGTAQKLSLNELHTMASYKNWETTNKFLIGKGWDYYDSSESDGIGYNTISWAHGRNLYDNAKAKGWFYVYNYEGMPNKIMYRFRQKEFYSAIIQQITANGYKLTDEEILDNRVVASYENKSFFLRIAYNREQDEEDDYYYSGSNKKTYTVYEVTIYKKGGVYDPNNGFKKDYDEYGNVSATYNLKDGKIEGLLTAYDSIGRVERTAQFKLGILEGPSVENFYFDNSEDYYRFYGNFKNGEREGKWIGEIVSSNEKQTVQELYYINGKKEGLNKEASDNKILFQNYKSDNLDGLTLEYLNLKRILAGGYPSIDTISNKVVLKSQLQYKDNKLNGNAKYFDISGSIISEGTYADSLKTGLWKFYHEALYDSDGKPLDCGGKLYKESNYIEGKLEGVQKRFSLLEKNKVPCKQGEEDEEGCYETICVYFNEIATYSDDELNGSYEVRGSDNELWSKGIYLNGKETGKWILYGKSKFCFWLNKKSFETGIYLNGQKQGKWERYENSDLLESYSYSNDIVDGEHITYAFNKPSERKYFKKGKFYRLEKLDGSGNVSKSYAITNETESKLDCEVIETLSTGVYIQKYSFIKTADFIVSPITFQLDFESADQSIKKRNGLFEHKSLDGKLITIGNFTSDVKTGDWEYYYYDQNVKATFTYDGYGHIIKEYYFDLKRNEPFSDEFIFKAEDGTYEERKIKNGVRNGTTRYKDANDKTIKKESYKDGILKE